MSESTVNNISKKVNGFLQGNWAFVLFIGGMLTVSIMNLLLFGLVDGYSVDTEWWDNITKESNNAWIGWFEICLAGTGSTLTIWGVVWTLRFDKRFIFPLLIGEIIVVIDAIILGWVFTALSYVIMIISAIYNYIMWNREEDNEPKMDLFNWMVVIVFIGIYVTGGLSALSIIDGKLSLSQYNDVISSGIVAASWYVVLRKSKWGFVTFVVTDLLYLVAYTAAGVPATGFSYLIYLLIDSTSFISWWYIAGGDVVEQLPTKEKTS